MDSAWIDSAPLRIMTAGSVDDGKSTLIGRLMYDLDLITDDLLSDLKSASKRNGRGDLDLSLFTDGLTAEREQGITIDLAYRYFRYQERNFILCDSPGHVQYTRNMVCGASQSDVALIMIDARTGPIEQTLRHWRITQWLCVPTVIFVVNKLDLVGFSQERFDQIEQQLMKLQQNDGSNLQVIPVCALDGDNVVHPSLALNESRRLTWYRGPTLVQLLLRQSTRNAFDQDAALRFTVQRVMRPTGKVIDAIHHDFRALSGRVESGTLQVGQTVQALSADTGALSQSVVTSIHTYDGTLESASAGMNISVVLADDLDITRGDVLASTEDPPQSTQNISLQWCWMSEQPAKIGQRVLFKQGARSVHANIISIGARLNLQNGLFEENRDSDNQSVQLNEIVQINLQLARPVLTDRYVDFPRTGSAILLDPLKFDTLAAGVYA